MSFPRRIKDPDAVLDFATDWSGWLQDGETITLGEALTATIDGGVILDSVSYTDTNVTAWISGGTAGVNYDVTFRVTTSVGRIDDRTITVVVKER